MKLLNLINRARLLALESKMGYGKHGAIIVKNNKVIASGTNNIERTTFLNGLVYSSCHAEIDAMMELLRNFNAFPRSKKEYCFL